MNVIQLSPGSLIPYEFNARNHDEEQIDRIANSIKEFGFNQPIVIDKDNVVIVGHGRLAAAKKLGLDAVPVVRRDNLTETQLKAYRILDNKLQNDSTWSFDNLNLELGFLEDNGLDLESWGLDELKELIEPEPEAHEDDFVTPEIKETFLKRGDLVELGRHRVLCGDSTSDEDVAELLDGTKVDACITDPPYSVNYDRSHLERGGKKEVHEAYHEADLDPSDLLTFIDLVSCDLLVFSYAVQRHMKKLLEATERNKFEVRKELVWVKNNISFWMGAAFQQKHEPIWIFTRNGAAFSSHVDSTATTVLEYNKPVAHDLHPTAKPLELWGYLINQLTASGDMLYEPFLGSGTTLIACEQLNRICYGMEIEPKYCEVIIRRYLKHCQDNNKPFDCKVNGEPLPEEWLNKHAVEAL